jgi:outer membrane receptor protein involved in Fe transport
VSAGGTAVDIMKNVPSVQVDIDGNVKLRNSTPQLFIDGRLTTLTLDQIPADAIESVEVITNPSAKYDASGGGAGILNIVLKKNKKQGYNGSVRAGVDKNGGVNGGIDLNLRQQKFNISASVNGNLMRDINSGTTTRLNLTDVPQTQLYQVNSGNTNGGMVFSRVGLDYFVSNRTTLSVTGFMINANFKPNDYNSMHTDSLYSSGITSSFSDRSTASQRSFNGKGVTLSMKHLFPKAGEELTFDANYFSGSSSGNALYTTNYYTGSAVTGTDLQKILNDGSDQNLILQADYVKPISSLTKIEAGVRGAFRSRITNNYNYLFSKSAGIYALVPSATSNYSNSDDVSAAYATISSSIKKFTYKVGLRAESSSYNGTLQTTGQQYNNKYPVSLFPSVFLSQKLGGDQDLQFSYTRRVNRPNFFQLIPFADSTDKLNITKGNPDLVPEFTQSFEVSYMKRFKGNNSLLASVYYKNTTNLITRYVEQQTDPLTGNTALINTYINANSSYSAGLELTSVNYLTKWLDISTNVNLYNSKVNTSNVTSLQQDAMWSWFAKFNGNFKLPSNFTIQLSGMYQSKSNLPVNTNTGMMGPPGMQAQSASQGYIKAFYGVDLAIKKTFLKDNAASVSLSVNDIFRTRINDQYSYSDYFIQDYSRLRSPQLFRLTFSYRFGKIDMNLFKRKTAGSLQAGADSMQQ